MKILALVFSLLLATASFAQNDPDSIEKLIQKIRKEHQALMEDSFNKFFDDDFFKHDSDPFAEMKKMREMMMKQFNSPSIQFDNWFEKRLGGGSIDDIKRDENDKEIIFKIKVDNIKDKKVDIKVENGAIAITGQTNIENHDGSNQGKSVSKMQSSFSRSFPVPEGVKEKEAKIDIDGDTITITLPKIKGYQKKSTPMMRGGDRVI